MNIFLVDYENTKDLTGIKNLTNNDFVEIFYSKNSNTLTFETSNILHESNAKITYHNVDVGKPNALDLQLVSYLGYLIKQYEGKDTKFYIVSKDNGYTFVISFWKKYNVNISLVTNLEKQTQNESNNKINNEIRDLLLKSEFKNELTEKDIAVIINIINQYKTISAINNNLCKHFNKNNTLAGKILKTIKPKLKTQLNKK